MPRPKSESPINGADRIARHRQAVKALGGRQLSSILLSADDARKLAKVKARRGIAQDAEMIRTLIREF